MFGKIIKAEDLQFLENDSFRTMFADEIVDKIVGMLKEYKEKASKVDSFLLDKPFGSININYDISKAGECLFSIKLEYGNLTCDIITEDSPLMKRMYQILREMDLIFTTQSNIEGVRKDNDYDYTLCTFSKDEYRKMFSTGRMLPALQKKNLLVDSHLHNHISLMIYNMFGSIVNSLVVFNNENPVAIFYGDINHAFKDWVEK